MIAGFEKPEVLTYSLESTIAEKFDAIISRMELIGRMKDFFDIYYLASTCDFEGRKLQEAIYETLQNRGTPYERDTLEQVKELAKNKDILIRWNSFCMKTFELDFNFDEVIEILVKFIMPVYQAILNENECFMVWNKDERMWEAGKMVKIKTKKPIDNRK